MKRLRRCLAMWVVLGGALLCCQPARAQRNQKGPLLEMEAPPGWTETWSGSESRFLAAPGGKIQIHLQALDRDSGLNPSELMVSMVEGNTRPSSDRDLVREAVSGIRRASSSDGPLTMAAAACITHFYYQDHDNGRQASCDVWFDYRSWMFTVQYYGDPESYDSNRNAFLTSFRSLRIDGKPITSMVDPSVADLGDTSTWRVIATGRPPAPASAAAPVAAEPSSPPSAARTPASGSVSIRIDRPEGAESDGRDLRLVSAPASRIHVEGWAYGAQPISSVTIRGQEAPISAPSGDAPDGMTNAVKFAADVRLGLGRNEIAVEAVDVNGNRGSARLVVRRTSGDAPVAELPPGRLARAGRRFALLIGVEHYQNPEINPLRYTSNDVGALRQTLVERCGYAASRVRVLTDASPADRKPTRVNVELAMNWLAAVATRPEDTILIYFSGHGTHDRFGSYLLTRECNPDALLTTALNISDFNKLVAGIPAGKKIVVLDACHSGGMSLASRGVEHMSADMRRDFLAQDRSATGEIRLLSCRDDEESYDDPAVRHGVFSYFLLQGLRGSADADHNGFVTFPELEEYVQTRVHRWAAMKGKRQTPTADNKVSGLVIMSEVRR